VKSRYLLILVNQLIVKVNEKNEGGKMKKVSHSQWSKCNGFNGTYIEERLIMRRKTRIKSTERSEPDRTRTLKLYRGSALNFNIVQLVE